MAIIPADEIFEKYNLEDKKRQDAWRFQEQCFLMLKMTEIIKADDSVFENFCKIEHQDPYEYNNLLFKKSPDADLLMNLNSAQLSLLVPEIRIYKDYVDPDTKKSVSIQLPFEDYTDKNKIQEIMKTSVGRGSGVGLKSFSWKSLGFNSANKLNFAAELVLFFQNIEDLFEIRNIKNAKINGAGGTVTQVKVSYKDLIYAEPMWREGDDEGSMTWNKDYFRLKVVCGYQIPEKSTGLFDDKTLDALRETKQVFFLTNKQHNLNFGEDGSVELTLEYIAYTDAIVIDPLKSNILFSASSNERTIKKAFDILTENLKKDIKELEKRKNKAGLNEEDEYKLLEKKKVLEKREEKLQEANINSKLGSYQRILENLLVRGRLKAINVPRSFFRMQLDRKRDDSLSTLEDLEYFNTCIKNLETKGYLVLDQATGQPANPRVTQLINNIIFELYEDKDTAEAVDAGLIDRGIAYLSDLVGEGSRKFGLEDLAKILEGSRPKDKLSNQLKQLKSLAQITKEDLKNSTYILTYFTLGDLFDVVLDKMFGNEKNEVVARTNKDFLEKELKILFGNFTFYDYGKLTDTNLVMRTGGLKNEKFSYNKVYTGERTSVNIADIPISLKVFTSWFVDNIADKGLETMTFRDFVDGVLNDLVVRALSSECRDFAPKQESRFVYKGFSIPASKKRTDFYKKYRRETSGEYDGFGYRIPLNEFVKEKNNFRLPESKIDQEVSTPMENYMLIYATTEHPFDLKRDYYTDRRKGIHHLYFGNEVGLVKNISFERVDNPTLRSANIANNIEDSSKPRILREKYNANIEMMGNNLFEIGDQVHITPSIIGSGAIIDRSRVLRDLGIGGYFSISTVESKIEDGGFSTTIATKWTARGDGTFNIGYKEVTLVDAKNVSPNKLLKEIKLV